MFCDMQMYLYRRVTDICLLANVSQDLVVTITKQSVETISDERKQTHSSKD